MSMRLKAYRWINQHWIRPLVRTDCPSQTPVLQLAKRSKTIWFHASSVGELESLWPVILAWAERQIDLVITIFSPSASPSLKNLVREIQAKAARLLYSGFAPWEGGWRRELEALRPDLMVTVRYEAWPELWASLGELEIPLLIISARIRRSLRFAQLVNHALGGELPELHFSIVEEADSRALSQAFPGSRIRMAGDPRWSRVRQRAEKTHSRVIELEAAFRGLPTPWGILGSVWPEDLEILKLAPAQIPGTLWVVPHRVDRRHLTVIAKYFAKQGFNVLRSSENGKSQRKGKTGEAAGSVILVEETGFLLELYALGDWAYVGGGFGRGVHSTIEPAVHSIPIAIGPKNAGKFVEIQKLQQSGQLKVIKNGSEFSDWVMCTGRDYFDKGDRMDSERSVLCADDTVEQIVQNMEECLDSRKQVPW